MARGFPASTFVIPSSQVGVPTSYRTVAEAYLEGSPSYQYTAQGDLSRGIPYATSALVLGWQVNPTLDNAQIVQIRSSRTFERKNKPKNAISFTYRVS